MLYQEIAADMISNHISIKEKNVLEIGGAGLEAAKKFLFYGAKHVTVTNIGHGIDKAEKAENITTMYANALQLDEVFDEPFDIIFGVAILEHIPKPEQYLHQIYNMLKPGGYVCLTGGPIWTGPRGHHVWAIGENMHYKFSDITKNPVPNWAHLLMSSSELFKELTVHLDIPSTDAKKIVEWIYNGNNINRLSSSTLRRTIYESKLNVVEYQENRQDIPNDIHKKLTIKCGIENDYGVAGIQVVLQKPL